MANAANPLEAIFRDYDVSFVLSNPREPDNPIIYASSKFLTTTGYSPAEILGRNCRLLQGPGTSRQAVMEIRDALREERSATVCLLNYRKDGVPFWNAFHLAPIHGPSGLVQYYIGIQADVTRDVVRSSEGAAAAEGVQEAAERERTEAARITRDVLDHQAQMQARVQATKTCGAGDSVPSSLVSHLARIGDAFVLSDPNLPDTPMVFCSPAFLRLTGYQCTEMLGFNCRKLQGPGTDTAEVEKIREAMRAERPVTVTLLNYKKSGEAFWNCLHISPIRDANGKVQFFAGVQLNMTAAAAAAGTGGAAAAVELQQDASSIAAATEPPSEVPTPSALQLLMQKGVVGAVRVASRSLSGSGLRRAPADQHAPDGAAQP